MYHQSSILATSRTLSKLTQQKREIRNHRLTAELRAVDQLLGELISGNETQGV